MVVPDCEPHPGCYIRTMENGSGGVTLSNYRLTHQTLRPSDEGHSKREGGPSKLLPDTQEESFADVRASGIRKNAIGAIFLKNSNVWVCEFAARNLRSQASPCLAHPTAHARGFQQDSPPFVFSWTQTEKFYGC